MLAIMLANAGLITVLLINEGASQGALLQSNSSVLLGQIIKPSDGQEGFTKNDYVTLRKAGFTSLIALAERQVNVACGSDTTSSDSDSFDADTKSTLRLVGVDYQPLLGSAFSERKASLFNSTPTTTNNAQNQLLSNAALIHPITSAKLACDDLLTISTPTINTLDTRTNETQENQKLKKVISTRIEQGVILVAMSQFYSAGITEASIPLSGFVSVNTLTAEDMSNIQTLIGNQVVLQNTSQQNETGSLPQSFKLNLWAISALMGVVALFIVLNAINLMYRTRLPNIVRLRQLGIGQRELLIALYAELLCYCIVSIPAGMAIGFYAASALSPIISGTFSSLFNAVFINPDVNLLFLFALTLSITFVSLLLFAVVPVSQLTNALTPKRVRSVRTLSVRTASLCTAAAIAGLITIQQTVHNTGMALLFVAALLLLCCSLVLLWLPLLAKSLAVIAPKSWPVFHFVMANMHLLSGKTKLAVCAFFIALTANIGMNTMTDSFRSATEQWLDQRLYAPFYLYTDQPLSTISLPSNAQATPLLRAQGKATFKGKQEASVSISSYPTHALGREALVVDFAQPNAWRNFVEGRGVYVNQQLAFSLDISVGETLILSNVTYHPKNNASPSAARGDEKGDDIFALPVSWTVLGIYPDYGNLNGQLLVPLPYFNRVDTASGDALFSGVMAIHNSSEYEITEPNRVNHSVSDSVSSTVNHLLSNTVSNTAHENSGVTKSNIESVLKLNAKDGIGQLFSQQELMALSLNTFDKTFVLTDGLNITTLLVAGIAFAVSLTVLTLGNAAQLSVLRALGVSQLKVKAVLFIQYLLLCLVTALLSVPCGIYLAYVFINLVNRYAFNWSYSLSINVQVIATSVGVSLLIISLVLLLPLGKLKPKIDLRQDTQL
ncbi:FtsX-like permease family protein [Alteromonas sp. MTD1]|uniref:FtsX-like permease family protein n=1 Tax=Alteromonas sp. MTD1 TaxID=3057962 RepID=UPI0036F1CE9E